MPRHNYALNAQLDEWFIQIYESGNAFKKYLSRQKIESANSLTVDQSIEIIRRCNKVNALRLLVTRATNYIEEHQEQVKKEMSDKAQAIGQELTVLNTLYAPFEQAARNTIEKYIDIKNKEGRTLGYMDEMKPSDLPTREQLIEQLSNPGPIPMDSRYKSVAKLKGAVATIIEKNRRKNDAWKETYQTVQLYYRRVDQEVKSNVHSYAQAEFRILERQHEDYMKWLNVFEAAMVVAQKNSDTLFKNVDNAANWRAKMGFMLAHGCADLITSPLGLNSFIDVGVAAVNQLIHKIELSKGKVELDAKQSKKLFSITGILPDPNSKTYEKAYEQLAKETIYDKISRHKKYLMHKMDSLSLPAALADMMSDDSKLWGGYTPDQIIAAQRMETIDQGQYNKSDLMAAKSEIERYLIDNISSKFNTSVKAMFQPLQDQYGNKESWRGIHQLIDRIEFNGTRTGADSHNQYMDNTLVKTLSNEIEIYFIVKYLHENTRYFGGSNYKNKFHRGYASPNHNDFGFGHRPDNIACDYLVDALLKRLIKSKNTALKEKLGIATKLPEAQLLKCHPLKKPSFLTFKAYGRNLFEMRWPYLFSSSQPSPLHQNRQNMIQAITDTYMQKDLGELLQEQLVDFGKQNGIQIEPHLREEKKLSTQLESHWLSDADLDTTTEQKITPYVERADKNKASGLFFGRQGLAYYRNAKMIDEATQHRANDICQEKSASKRIKSGV